jgi:GT2 family glycosyltransferase
MREANFNSRGRGISAEQQDSDAGISRPCVKGKFLFLKGRKFYARGVTYGPFRPEPDGCEFHRPELVRRDFEIMLRNGINALRVYTQPPRWLLDLAAEAGMQVLIGLPWEQHVAFLSERTRAREIERRIRASARECAGHPAVLAYAVGNEIPAPIVRWYGHRRIEQYIERLYWAAKEEDPGSLVTYVNYPSTEYLELPFLDFASFNVYLETEAELRPYLARLQNLTGDRPLVMGELGLDSLRNGEQGQAHTLKWQTQTAFAAGCAGLFVFAWTDEWHRGGHDVEDWRFGLTTVTREPKPALETVRQEYQAVPFPASARWPQISVVICSHNGGRTLRGALEGLRRLDYPSFEIILVDDGSTDNTASLGEEFGVKVIRIPNGGLSNARNVGWKEAQGEIVAYLDDDATPDTHWLRYLASVFETGDYAGVGGPNIAFPEDGLVAQSVDHSPGNPMQVLVTDTEAEHLPGCNMAFRKRCLEAIGGFDTQFRIAGDDVDLCWRLRERGWRLGFHPAAMVWHHRRGTVRTYWKQQLNYGRAEAMLERKWPEKYNAVGHATWNGRLYSKGLFSFMNWSQRRIYHGTWGSALFQSVYSQAPGNIASILMLPEWYLVIGLLALITACSPLYPPLRYGLPLLALAFVPPLIHALLSGARAFFKIGHHARWSWLQQASVTALLHFLQPAARLYGRLGYGLTPWRRRGSGRLTLPRPQSMDLWSESNWQSADQRLSAFEAALRKAGASVARGGEFDRYDLKVKGGLLGAARLLLVVEEHGDGRQQIRLRLWPTAPPTALAISCLFAFLAMVSALDLEWIAWFLLNIPAVLLAGRTCYECAVAMGALREAVTPKSADAPIRNSSAPSAAELAGGRANAST